MSSECTCLKFEIEKCLVVSESCYNSNNRCCSVLLTLHLGNSDGIATLTGVLLAELQG